MLAGFNKDYECFLFVNFPAESDPKGWLAEIAPDVASTEEVAAFNKLFKSVSARRNGKEGTVKATGMNLALSASGLTNLGVAPTDIAAFSSSFRAGMKAQASTIGDVGANSPEHWLKPFGSTDIHAVVILASDSASDLDAAALHHIERLGDHDLRLLFKQDGKVRADLPGHEHFGFKDGISQPGIRGFTEPNSSNPNEGQPGQERLWPGEFVLGYPAQAEAACAAHAVATAAQLRNAAGNHTATTDTLNHADRTWSGIGQRARVGDGRLVPCLPSPEPGRGSLQRIPQRIRGRRAHRAGSPGREARWALQERLPA
jgi:deferrochelatase/peroxidase EfeB